MNNKLAMRTIGVFAAVSVLVGLGACSTPGASSSSGGGSTAPNAPVIIGQDVALTGQFSVLGVPESQGAKAAAAYMNAHGGILGHKIQLIVKNDQSSPQEAAAVAKQLITSDHASILIGPEETSEIGAVSTVASAYNVIDMQTDPFQEWPPSEISSQSLKYIFPEIMAFDSTNASAYESAIWKPKGYTKIALLTDSTPFGTDMIKPLEQVAKSQGFTVTGVQTFAAGSTDVTPQVQSLLSGKPQFLVDWTAPGPDTTTAVKTIRALAPTLPLGISGGQDTPATVSALGQSVANGLYAVTTIADGNVVNSVASSNPQKSIAQQFVRVMKAEGVDTENGADTAYQGFDSLYLIQNAAQSAKSVSTSGLLNALEHQNVAGITNVWRRTPSDHGGSVQLPGYIVRYNGSAWQYVKGS